MCWGVGGRGTQLRGRKELSSSIYKKPSTRCCCLFHTLSHAFIILKQCCLFSTSVTPCPPPVKSRFPRVPHRHLILLRSLPLASYDTSSSAPPPPSQRRQYSPCPSNTRGHDSPSTHALSLAEKHNKIPSLSSLAPRTTNQASPRFTQRSSAHQRGPRAPTHDHKQASTDTHHVLVARSCPFSTPRRRAPQTPRATRLRPKT